MSLSNRDLPFILAFSQIAGVGSMALQRLFDYFKNFEQAWRAPAVELLRAKIHPNLIAKIQADQPKINPEELYQEVLKENIKILTLLDENYPERLRQIFNPPFLLYYQGSLNFPQTALTVVGSRQCSAYGKQTLTHLLQPLANQPLTIVSGLAIGIDSLAHQNALKNNLPTAAVVGSGLSRSVLYPRQNHKLAEEILNHDGCLISELPPKIRAQAPFFPRRNRIMAGLAQATLVIEADITSGALITAKYALDFNREVLAVPGSIFSPKSAGPNWLVSQGAKVITKAEDLLEILALPNQNLNPEQPISFPGSLAQKIYQLIKTGTVSIDQLTNQIKDSSPTDVLVSLSSLELANLIKKENGVYYII